MTNIPKKLLSGLPYDTDLELCEITTGEDVGISYLDDITIVILPGFVASDDGSVTVKYPQATTASDAVEEYVSSGDWGDCSSTAWVGVTAWQVGYYLSDDNNIETVELNEETFHTEIEAVAPDCIASSHTWREVEGSLQCSGGGVAFESYCITCGIYCYTDTWASDCGMEGLTSESYSDGDDNSFIWILRDALRADYDDVDNQDAHDWIVGIMTGTDVTNGYQNVMECDGYSIPKDITDIIYVIHKYMPYYSAMVKIKELVFDLYTTTDGMSFSANNTSVTNIQELVGDKYTISSWCKDCYIIEL